jgi:DNA-directed RNA polymerase beta subunit
VRSGSHSDNRRRARLPRILSIVSLGVFAEGHLDLVAGFGVHWVQSQVSQKFRGFKNKTLADESKDLFNNAILSHISLAENQMTYFAKCRDMGLMIRRVIEGTRDPKKLDDKDYYGNKRLALAGQMVSLCSKTCSNASSLCCKAD